MDSRSLGGIKREKLSADKSQVFQILLLLPFLWLKAFRINYEIGSGPHRRSCERCRWLIQEERD